jgi:hypothetical protein
VTFPPCHRQDYTPRPSHPTSDVGKATLHLQQLRKHLVAIGHPAEAAAVVTVLDLLVPTRARWRTSRRRLP